MQEGDLRLGDDIRELERVLDEKVVKMELRGDGLENRFERMEFKFGNIEHDQKYTLDRVRELNEQRKDMLDTITRMQRTLDVLADANRDLRIQLDNASHTG